jgi:alkylation response protein AidB-like acyl-CoA dehydrogenase
MSTVSPALWISRAMEMAWMPTYVHEIILCQHVQTSCRSSHSSQGGYGYVREYKVERFWRDASFWRLVVVLMKVHKNMSGLAQDGIDASRLD